MIRYPAFDPPEYINWQADPQVVEQYARTIDEHAERRQIISQLSAAQLVALYEALLRNRLHDIALKRWVKQGVISKAWLGLGEEAATIGPVHALDREPFGDGMPTDFVAPMIRNAGACHEMGMPLAGMLCGYLGTADSPTRGRDLHIGDFHHGVLTPISHVGDVMAITNGIALAYKLRRQPRVAMTWIGDGSTKAGVFHESMTFAAVARLPIIIIIQDNKVALGTRLDQHHRGAFCDWPDAYGVSGSTFDGNNVLDAYAAVRLAAEACRQGQGPSLLIAETFRMGGHATHDEREARATFNTQLFEFWGKRDPIGLFENYLIEGALDLVSGKRGQQTRTLHERNAQVLGEAEQRVIAEIERAEKEALEGRAQRLPQAESAATGVYAEAAIASEKSASTL